MRRGRLDGVVQFDVGELGAADDALLRLRRQRIPAVEIVEIFLHDDVAAAGECRVLRADQHGVDHRLAARIFRAVDEAQEIAIIEVAEAVHLVDRRNRVSDPRHDLRRQLEAQIHALGADVEQEVAGRGDRMAPAGTNLPERVQFLRPRRPEQAVPRLGADPHDAG